MFEVLVDFDCFKKGDQIDGTNWGKQNTAAMISGGYVKPIDTKAKAKKGKEE